MNKNALPIILTTLALTACGGGGADPEKAENTEKTEKTERTSLPPATSVKARAQFDAGVFFFGGAGWTVNGVDQSYIRKTANGAIDPVNGNTNTVTTRYAGADANVANDLFDFLRFKKMGKSGWSSVNDIFQFAYGTGDSVTLVSRVPNNELNEQVKWDLSLSEQDLSGTPINGYLQSLGTAGKTPKVAGTFEPGTKALTVKYKANNDLLVASYSSTDLRDADGKPVTTMASLTNLTSCVRGADGKQVLVMQFGADGKINLYEAKASPETEQCAGAPPASALIGAAQYGKKPYGVHSYLDISFVEDFDFTKYFPLLGDKSARDAGVKLAIAQPANGTWGFAYFIPKGTTLTDPAMHMNQAAANGVKGALSLR